ncbi:hypothetical protein ACFYVL_03140 [Streptomyces sp. NPDC004111]|uniref:hypothetical protein n=1 Tax=Streptomyces sp. NPDC004111 TaxID=3364690 RepID=UPI0036A15623
MDFAHLEPVDREPAPARYGKLRVERDLAPARWLVDAFPDSSLFGTVAGLCTPGFPAYARVLHPAGLDGRPVRWDEVARSRPEQQHVDGLTWWYELLGAPAPYGPQEQAGQAGVWDEMPWEGPAPAPVAALLAAVLAGHTRTPERCWYGLWDGYGTYEWDAAVPVFATPHREHVLLSGTLAEVTSPAAPGWGGYGSAFVELPDRWWPEDRAWCVGGDTDLKSTYVGGSAACVAALLAAPGLEVHPVDPGSLLG